MLKELIVFTDCEADDLLACILLKYLENKTIVLKGVCVVSFDQKWNPVEKANNWFPKIGMNEINRFDYVYGEENIQSNFEKWLVPQLESSPTIMSLASMSMLYQMDHKIFNNCSLVCYGSANFRWSYDNRNEEDRQNFAKFINTSFLSTTIFETHFMFPRQDNTLNIDTVPKFCKKVLSSTSEETGLIVQSIMDWNKHILTTIIDKLMITHEKVFNSKELTIDNIQFKRLSKGTIENLKNLANNKHRGCKVILSIYKHAFQMVAADMIVALCYHPESKFTFEVGDITFDDKSMTIFKQNDKATIKMIKNLSMEHIDNLMDDCLK